MIATLNTNDSRHLDALEPLIRDCIDGFDRFDEEPEDGIQSKLNDISRMVADLQAEYSASVVAPRQAEQRLRLRFEADNAPRMTPQEIAEAKRLYF